jgi:hypothetical protein
MSILAGALASAARADDPPPGDYVPRDIADLQTLVAPIALYPDALLAQVLAATTYPDDVIAAARWEDAGNNPQGIDAQPWDTSVKGVARYPQVLHYLASNPGQLNDLGDAFLHQQADVMQAVQNLRGEALAAGTLVNTPQQTIINQDGYIQIIPTNPNILYVPQYNPLLVYSPPEFAGGEPYPDYITFGLGVDVGDWLDFDLDWYDRGIYFGHWGHDRPWWHDRDHGHYYLQDRPGIYRPGQFRDVGGHPINAAGGRWARDAGRPAPREVDRPIRSGAGRPERGYAPANRGAEAPRGADAARASERGRSSRQAAPEPARRAEPAHQAPARQEAPRPAPRAPARAPEARPSAPTRGGAIGGYTSGAAASHSSARGSASRGGGGGGGHGRRYIDPETRD